MNEATAPAQEPTPTPAKQPTPQELAAQARQHYEAEWNKAADKERVRIGIAKGLINKKDTLTTEELRARVPLPGDTMRYAKDKNGHLRLAFNRFGLPAAPKQKGRLKPHMGATAHGIKNTSIRIFRGLFSLHAQEAVIRAKNDGTEYVGLPTEEISKIGARAAVLGARQFKSETRARKNRARRRQELSRRINYGIQSRNTDVRAYIGG